MGRETMTDAEVICAWMEPRPGSAAEAYNSRWWNGSPWTELRPFNLTLDALREVESRLSEAQWDRYEALALKWRYEYSSSYRAALHASAEQKIKALAAVLRKEVEA